MPLWINVCFLMAFVFALVAWAALAINKKPTPQQKPPAPDNTYTAHLVEQLLKQDKVQSMTVKREGSVEVLDKDCGGVRFSYGPAIVVIVPIYEGEANATS
jgi:hypothetical protein